MRSRQTNRKTDTQIDKEVGSISGKNVLKRKIGSGKREMLQKHTVKLKTKFANKKKKK